MKVIDRVSEINIEAEEAEVYDHECFEPEGRLTLRDGPDMLRADPLARA